MKTSFDIEHYTLSRPEEVKEFAAFQARYMHITLLKYSQHTEDPATCYHTNYTETTRYDSFCLTVLIKARISRSIMVKCLTQQLQYQQQKHLSSLSALGLSLVAQI